MKKTILFLIIAANLAFATNVIYAQTGEWSKVMKVSCFNGFEAQTKNKGYEKGVNGYEWVGRITNNYGVDVTFDMYLKVGTEDYIVGQFTLKPGASTGAQSHYYKSASNNVQLAVDNVCFPSLGTCTASCFAECDGGTPNQNCKKPETAKQSEANEPAAVDWAYVEAEAKAKAAKKGGSAKAINGSPSTGVTTAKNDGAAKDLNGFASSNTAIKQQIVENLRANIPPAVESIRENGIVGAITITNLSVQTNGDSVTIKYTSGGDGPGNLGRQDRVLTMTFDQMRSTLKVATPPNHLEQGLVYLTTTNIRTLTSNGRWEFGSDGRMVDAGLVNWGNFFYDLGASNSNFNALKSLLNQLNGAPEPKKEDPSSLAAVKQKIVENLKGNIIRPFRFEQATRWGIPTVFTLSDISVDLSDNDIAIRYTMKIEGGYYLGTRSSRPGWNGYEPGSAQWQLVETIPLERLSSTLAIDLNNQNYSDYFKNTTNRVLIAYGREQILGQTFGGASGTARGPGHVYGDTTLFFYDVGPNNQNYDNLVALLRQLSGSPASAPTQTTANNPAPQTSTRPVISSSGNPAQDGVDLYAAKQYEQAVELFKAAIAKNPNDSGSSFNLGLSYNNLKRNDEAVAAFKQTIAIKPDWAAAYTELGNALDRSKHPAEAIAAFNKSLQLDPNNFATHYGLGNVQLGLDNRVAAIASYKEAVRIQPNFIACHKLLGTLYRYERLYTESIDSYREALKINPDDLDVNIELGTTYFIAEQYTESIEVLKKAVEISPKSAKAFTYLGRSYLATKQYDVAISALRMAVEIDKRDDYPHLLLGEAYCDQKNLPMALKEYNKLVALDSVLRFELKPQGYPLCYRDE